MATRALPSLVVSYHLEGHALLEPEAEAILGNHEVRTLVADSGQSQGLRPFLEDALVARCLEGGPYRVEDLTAILDWAKDREFSEPLVQAGLAASRCRAEGLGAGSFFDWFCLIEQLHSTHGSGPVVACIDRIGDLQKAGLLEVFQISGLVKHVCQAYNRRQLVSVQKELTRWCREGDAGVFLSVIGGPP